ncbi:zonadhesin [Symphalangus syndactylus]|nr:zonadhesin [Symphalangus syndactylus]
MVPPVWTLLLLVGAAPFRREKPPDRKLVVRSSRNNYVLTQCDFEDDAKPLCDWSQVSADDGDWVQASGPSPTGSIGPPGGYPNGEGSYLHMESNSFHRGGVARLRSPDLWEQDPLCVHFAYHMFRLSWGAQLRLLLLSGEEGRHPDVLWKHRNTQRPSWMPTTVTVPAGFTLPTRLTFEGTRGSTAYLDIALDALSIRRGSCNRVCMMQTCSFDIPNDLCDWTWIPTASGTKWTQKKGSSGRPGVGPDGDFSSPGSGRFMLLDPKNARPGQKAVLLSPVSPSSGCLSFSFHYILRGQSPGAALHIYASVLGSIRKHTLFSGQPGPNWQAVSVNYIAVGRIQFAVVGVFGKTPEPAVAVDATSIAPCGESFPQCDFEDNAHPFCDWVQTSGDGGHWALGPKNGPVHGMGPAGGFPNAEGHYIYLEADKFSQAGQSVRLVSRPFCALGDICVEFAYHMYGLGEGIMLELLLGSPAGSPPIPLWKRVGSQRPYWQNTSVTIPSGHQQPMQLIFKTIQGSNTAFVVAMGFILINPGTCPVKVLPELPPVSPVSSTGPSETTGLTENPTISTKKPTVSIEKPSVATEKPTVPKEKPTILTEKPTIPTEKPTIPSEKLTIPTEKPTIPSEKPTIPTEKPTIPSEKPTIPSEKPTIPTEKPTIPSGKPTIPKEEPTTPTEETTISTEEPAIPTEKPGIPTEKPSISTEKPSISTEKPTISPEKPTISPEKPTIPTEKPTISTEKPTVSTEELAIPTEKPTLPTEETTTSIEKTTISTEKPTISTEKPTIPTEKPTIPTEKPTISTEKPTISTEKPIIPTEKPTLPTEETTTSVEKTTISTEKPTIPTEKLTIPTEKPTISTEKPTIPTEKLTIPMEKPTTPTEKPTISTEKPTISTEKPTIPTEKPTISIEETTISTEKLTIPTEKPTIPTERLTALRPPYPSPTATGLAALVTSPHAPSAPMTSVILGTTTTPRSSTERCSPNARYESCACPASCKSPRPSCGPLCRGGCVCNPGFLFSDNHCIQASSCNCCYNNNYYEPGAEWFSPNCTEHCRCWPGSRVECQISQCGTHTVCQLKNGQYGCHPYAGTATCVVYGDPHYVTFDGRHFGFMGKCTYILAQPCGNSTDPFFRVTAKNEEQGQEGVSCLSKVYVTLPVTTVTLLKGRRTLVEGQRVTLPAIPSKGVFLGASGRFVELQTEFGLRVRWDGDQQLYVTVSSTYSGKLCGLCGNYDGNSDNDHLKSDGSPAGDKEELGNSWQTDQDEDQECQKYQVVNPPSCDSSLQSSMSGPGFCGRLVNTHGPFETCLLHVKATSFFDSCMLDMCRFQGLQHLLCTHMSTMTTTCQDAGHAVKPWREPHFCPMACPPNSKYSLCAKPCPDTCHSGFSGMFCSDWCMEACECNPGFVLSGLECIPHSQCGCLHPAGSYFKVGERWYKPGCKELCVCESNNRIRCQPWRCRAQEFCGQQDGIYGCHAQGAATCTASGDPHYLTFDGALHHFMGTCTYVLTRPCWSRSQGSYFVVSATNENRGGNLEVSYIKAVHVTVFDFSISLLRGCKVMLNGHRVALPVWPAQGRVTIRLSSNFVLLYTNFGLQVRYDGSHLVEVTVPSSYGSQLCGLCGNYNNNSLDDNLRPDRKPAGDSVQLGAAWKLPESSEPGCFLVGGKPSSCQENSMADAWNKNCAILINPQGPFSQCHQVVPPQSSFASCVHGQCGTKGDTTALCCSLHAYASLCAQAGQAPAWRNRTFCSMRCPPGSSYSPCGSPCPATCSSINDPRDCPKALPCAESCECQKGHILSGTSCVPLGQCGCTDLAGSYHPVGERWYTENTCTRLCTCSVHNNITCFQSTCKPNQMCWALDGLLRCRASGMGVCQLPGESHYVSFDGSNHSIPDACTHVLVKVCHPAMALPFFKISAKHEKEEGGTEAFRLHEVYIDICDAQVTLQKGHRVLINSKQVTLPAISQVPGVSVKSSSIYTIVNIKIGVQVKFDGNRLLEIEIPTTYNGKVCGVCGNFNDEEEDELMMPSDELAHSDSEFVNSWKDKDIDPSCQSLPVDEQQILAEQQENPSGNCRAADLCRAREKCETVLRAPVWAQCASRIDLTPFLVDCANTLCEFGGLHQAFCQALQAFGATCQSQGLKPPLWRNSSFCPLECPAYSSYTNCLPSCSPSCWDLDGRCEGAKVPSACAEGCICQPGYVLSEDKCVPRSQCGCKDAHGGSIPLGKSWVSSGCTENCVCTGGAIQCGDFRCPSGSHCQLSSDNSKSNCVSDKSEQCLVYGDPRYLTFDGFSYRFQGRMTYVLIKTVDVLPEGVEPLLVEGRNKMDPPRSSILQEVITTVYGYKVQLQAGLELVVNNQKMAVPYRPNEHLRVTLRGQRLYLVTDFELVVSFGGRKNAVISLPSMFEGLVRGLCGNYDKNRKNDMMLPSGALTQNLNTFGNSWEVKTEDALLLFPRAIPAEEEGQGAELGLRAGLHVSECSPEQLASNSTQACRALADPQGPFAACHQTVAPEPFQEHCMMDLCSAQDPREQEELRCQVLSGHGVSSRYHVSDLYDTLPSVLCQPGGPRGLRGPLCGRLRQHPRLCLQRHPEPPPGCGCTSNGIYYQLGGSFVTEDCSQRCTCASSRILLCEPFSCREREVCTVENHTRGCFPESLCLRNPCQNDGQCREQGATFTCECELGYGGDLCMEPRDVPPPRKPEASNLVAVLLGLLVPVVVVVLAMTREYIYRTRRKREKTQSQEGDRLARLVDTDTVLDCAC